MTLLLLLLACGGTSRVVPSTPPPTVERGAEEDPADLVVLIVVDQLPVRLLNTPAELYTGGLKTLTGPEARPHVARFAHAITYTCPGHATISTGVSPSEHGIVSNTWRDPRDPGTPVYCSDATFLQATTLAERVTGAGGQVASLSLKDRSAVMLGGPSPTLVANYDAAAAGFTGPLAGRVDLTPRLQPWTALHPDRYEAWVGPDDNPLEADPGIGTTFPHPAPSAGTVLYTPHGGDLLVDAALLAVSDLSLGQDGAPDLLALSFSQTDYIGHAFTAESWEALDNMVRLDRSIGRLLDGVRERIGDRKLTVLLTSDHGAMEAAKKARVPNESVGDVAQAAYTATGLDGVVAWAAPTLYLPADLPPADRERGAVAVAAAVRGMQGIATAWAWRHEEPLTHGPAMREAIFPSRSGDVYVVRGEDALFGYGSAPYQGTSHGTPFDEDAEVPLLVWGHGVVPGPGDAIDMREVARTAAHHLGVRWTDGHPVENRTARPQPDQPKERPGQ